MTARVWRFRGPAVEELSARLVVDPKAVRLEVRLDETGRMTFRVIGGPQTRETPEPDIGADYPDP